MENEEPTGQKWCKDVHPIGHAAYGSVLYYNDAFNPSEDDSTSQQKECGGEECVSYVDSPTIRSVVGIANVSNPESEYRQNDGDALCIVHMGIQAIVSEE